MTTKLTLAIIAGIAAGIGFGLWWIGVVTGVAVLTALLKQNAESRVLMVLDTDSGSMQVQPNDRLTEEYLKKRG